MASLISVSDKAEMESALLDVFDTFKRPVVAYKEPEKVIISTSPNYSRFGQRDQNVSQPEVAPQRFEFYAVIKYENQQNLAFAVPLGGGAFDSSQMKLTYSDNRTRIKVDQSGYAVLSDAKLIELDGANFAVDTDKRVHGLFGTGMYTFYLSRQ